MIKNERQYRISQNQVRHFRTALQDLGVELGSEPDSGMLRLEHDAVQSQLESLERELSEYRTLVDLQPAVITLESFGELPEGLIKARIASGFSQRQLAERVGLKEQQIQRYEATDYASASFSRMQEIAQALGLRVRNEIFLSDETRALRQLKTKLNRLGASNRFIERRLLSRGLNNDAMIYADLAATASKVFRVPESSLREDTEISLSLDLIEVANFKKPAKSNEASLVMYSLYSHFISQLALEATVGLESHRIPTDWSEFRREVIESFGQVGFRSVLQHVWAKGIAVVPFADPGTFHAAVWRNNNRDIVVLKQQARSESRWLFDLLHECYHVASNLQDEGLIVEEIEEDLVQTQQDEECNANEFAGNVILNGQATEFAQEAVEEARGNLRFLKRATVTVASRRNVDVGALANYVAWRLSLQGESWWSTANNLQIVDADPWEYACDQLLAHTDLSSLDESDRELFLKALERS